MYGNGLVVLFIGPPPASQFVSRQGCALVLLGLRAVAIVLINGKR